MRSDLDLAARVRGCAILEAPLGAGALDPGCREGPAAFRESGAPARLARLGLAVDWHSPPGPLAESTRPAEERIARMAEWLAAGTERLVAAGTRFAVLGGDHSCAVGTWAGAARAARPRPLGLVWIDAHLDMHRPETTHSGAINGMPVACLLGHGASRLTRIAGAAPALDPRHLCIVGVRSFEPEEDALARALGVRVITMAEVRARGLSAALDEARAIAADGTAGYGVSLDLDAVDPRDAPAVGTPEPHGIRAAELLPGWRELTGQPGCLGIEIAELNPFRDEGRRTVRLAGELIAAAFARRHEGVTS